MWRTILLALALAGGALALPPVASACCHVHDVEEEAGPCRVEWRGDGFRLVTDSLDVTCLGAGVHAGPFSPWDLLP